MTAAGYSTLANFRTYLRAAEVADDADDPDTALEILALESAAAAINKATGRKFSVAGDTATARYFSPMLWAGSAIREAWSTQWFVFIDDLVDTTGLTVAIDTLRDNTYATTVTDYSLYPSNAAAQGVPYSRILLGRSLAVPRFDGSVKVTAKWGWDATPAIVEQANLIQAARLLKRRDAPFGVAGSPDMGSEMRLLSKLDPDVEMLVSVLRRW